jgi:hypothetical protein
MVKLNEAEEIFLKDKKKRQDRFRSNFVKAAVALFLLWGGILFFIFYFLNTHLSDPALVPMGLLIRAFLAQTLILVIFVFAFRRNLLGEEELIKIIDKLRKKK